jgi:cold shock CspA family protein
MKIENMSTGIVKWFNGDRAMLISGVWKRKEVAV